MVSVIISTFGEPCYLPRAINSVLTQTFSDFEVIVVDDNNPDTHSRKQTENIMEQYRTEDKVKYIQHKKNRNGAAARNTGASAARGKYIAFLDNDDFYLPRRLEECMEIVEKEPSISIVFTDVAIVKDREITKIVKVRNANVVDLLMDTNLFGTGSNIFISRELFNELGGFDESFLRHQDIEFMVRGLEIGKAYCIPKVLIVKVHTGANSADYERYLETKKMFNCKFERIIDSLSDENKNKYYSKLYEDLFFVAIRGRKRSHINAVAKSLSKYRKLSIKELIYCAFPMLFTVYHGLKKKEPGAYFPKDVKNEIIRRL